MKVRIVIDKKIKLYSDKSILYYLQREGIEATEQKLLNGTYLTEVPYGKFNKQDLIKKIKGIFIK